MSSLSCSAPGKLFLGGEYAVLDGAEAVVTAVNRRAVAVPLEKPLHPSPIVAAVREHAARFITDRGGSFEVEKSIQVSSPGFRIRGQKIGVGSSAAVCAAACGACFEMAGMSIDENRSAIFDVASTAHRAAQGGKGSGADVAAAVFGGTLIFSINGDAAALSLESVEIVAVWSGRAASTTDLIMQINAYAARDPAGHRARFEELHLGARGLADAYRMGDPAHIIAATDRYGRIMTSLGNAASAPIVTTEHELITTLARDLNGAAKPSGAGGGDVAIGVFEDPDAAKRFRVRCRSHSLIPLDISMSAPGLRRDEDLSELESG